jgi:hypothetical protein
MGMLDLIADQIKQFKSNTLDPPTRHELVNILESMRIVLQQHEALLLYAHKTLDLEYHRRADEIYKKMNDSFEEDKLKGALSSDERLVRIERFGREAKEARAKLDEEFNIGEKADG